MKYCPKCKIRMPGDGNVCTKCGGALRTIGMSGAAGETAAGAGDPEQLVLRLQGLQHEVGRSRRRMYILAGLAAALMLLFVLLLVSLYVGNVNQYATVSHVDILPSDESPGAVEIRYLPATAGKVEFIRETAGRTETLIEHATPTVADSKNEPRFTWGGSKSAGVIRVKYRDGWRIVDKSWPITGAAN